MAKTARSHPSHCAQLHDSESAINILIDVQGVIDVRGVRGVIDVRGVLGVCGAPRSVAHQSLPDVRCQGPHISKSISVICWLHMVMHAAVLRTHPSVHKKSKPSCFSSMLWMTQQLHMTLSTFSLYSSQVLPY
jgi:hypothetical protein